MCMSRRYTSETHQVTTTAIRSEQMCNYDLDDMDLRYVFDTYHFDRKSLLCRDIPAVALHS